jgi:kynurenine formamidase
VTEHRVQFDFEITFSNGGGLRGQGFRLDIPGEDISDAALADYLVRDMRLLMVGTVRILNKTILAEAHKRPRSSGGAARLVDLSHDVEDGMVTYRGLPPPVIRDHWTREESRRHFAPGTEFHIGRIDMVANTGTYLDSPFHRYAEGRDLAGLPLESLADLPGVVVRAAGRPARGIDVADLASLDVRGKAVLLHTGWDVHWRTDRYFDGHPFLTAAGAEWLAERGAVLVGIDSLNIDDTADLRRSAHSMLLGRDIPVVEHLCGLEQLPNAGFRFFAVPVKVRAFGTFPVRAFAVIQG